MLTGKRVVLPRDVVVKHLSRLPRSALSQPKQATPRHPRTSEAMLLKSAHVAYQWPPSTDIWVSKALFACSVHQLNMSVVKQVNTGEIEIGL